MPDQTDPRPRRVEETNTEWLVDEGRFKFYAVDVSHELSDGAMSPPEKRFVFDRGNAVAAVLFDPEHQEVIAVEQFRCPTIKEGRHGGWIIETSAAMPKTFERQGPNGPVEVLETDEACLVRRVLEETGYRITTATKIATFFSSPGGTTERITLYFAEVRRPLGDFNPIRRLGGDEIKVLRIPVDQFYYRLQNGDYEDPKLIIGGQWLKDRLLRDSVRIGGHARPTVFNLKQHRGKSIGYYTCDIKEVKDVEVWVNSESTDMQMSWFTGRSVSAAIRSAGAAKSKTSWGLERITEDTIGNALRREMKGREFVNPAQVLQTTPGRLEESNGVRRLFHVAVVQGLIGDLAATNPDTLKLCVDNVLTEIERASDWPPGFNAQPYKSVLFPMLGTGDDGFHAQVVAPLLVERALNFFKRKPNCHLERINFLAYSVTERVVLPGVLQGFEAELELVKD